MDGTHAELTEVDMKRVAIVVVLVVVILITAKLGFDAWHNTEYYRYRDLAVASCRSGDMQKAYDYLQTALEHARDPDLINEGLHYKRLFDYRSCEE